MESTPAERLARLIEFGNSAGPTDPVPDLWQPAFMAVWQVRGSRAARMQAFVDAIQGTPERYTMLEQVLQAVPARENRQYRNHYVWSAADALNDPPAVEWCVEDLFQRPSLNALVGDPGSKKTLLALDLAVCLSIGKPWLDHTVIPCPALIVDEETGRPRLWSRIHQSLVAHSGTAETPLFFQSLPGYDLRSVEDAHILQEAVEECSAGFIVIDALADVLRGGDENSVLSVTPVFNNLRRLAEDCHAAILIVHHNNKTGGFRGSSSISAGVDLMLSVESPADSPLIRLQPLKTRHASPRPFTAEAHFETDRFWLSLAQSESTQLIVSPKLSPTANRVLGFVARRGQASTPQLMAEISENSPGAIRNLIHDLVAGGYLVRVDGGSRGAKATFELSARGLEHVKK